LKKSCNLVFVLSLISIVLKVIFLYDDEDERNEEYAHFFFIGKHEGKEVIMDTVLYTLRFQHESEIFDNISSFYHSLLLILNLFPLHPE
jgi:hypothetical protein